MTTDEVLAVSLGNVRAIRDWTNKKVDRIYEDGFASKNLLNHRVYSMTQNTGIDLTVNSDGSYTLNGTANQNCFIRLTPMSHDLDNKRLKLVGCPAGGSVSTYVLKYVRSTDGGVFNWATVSNDLGNGVILDTTPTTYGNFFVIVVYKDTTINHLTFKPMLVDADLYPNATYDDYEPYAKSNVEITNELTKNKIRGSVNANNTIDIGLSAYPSGSMFVLFTNRGMYTIYKYSSITCNALVSDNAITINTASTSISITTTANRDYSLLFVGSV